ncbi:hypothetical protein ABPG75_012431 [Micractinium tetrahymenae]
MGQREAAAQLCEVDGRLCAMDVHCLAQCRQIGLKLPQLAACPLHRPAGCAKCTRQSSGGNRPGASANPSMPAGARPWSVAGWNASNSLQQPALRAGLREQVRTPRQVIQLADRHKGICHRQRLQQAAIQQGFQLRQRLLPALPPRAHRGGGDGGSGRPGCAAAGSRWLGSLLSGPALEGAKVVAVRLWGGTRLLDRTISGGVPADCQTLQYACWREERKGRDRGPQGAEDRARPACCESSPRRCVRVSTRCRLPPLPDAPKPAIHFTAPHNQIKHMVRARHHAALAKTQGEGLCPRLLLASLPATGNRQGIRLRGACQHQLVPQISEGRHHGSGARVSPLHSAVHDDGKEEQASGHARESMPCKPHCEQAQSTACEGNLPGSTS